MSILNKIIKASHSKQDVIPLIKHLIQTEHSPSRRLELLNFCLNTDNPQLYQLCDQIVKEYGYLMLDTYRLTMLSPTQLKWFYQHLPDQYIPIDHPEQRLRQALNLNQVFRQYQLAELCLVKNILSYLDELN